MNKLFKGAIASAAGVALLLGGAGTFALWNATTNVGTDAVIDAGHLGFGDVPPGGTWTLNGGPVGNIEDAALVPGDVLTYTLDDIEIVAHGTNLAAELGFTWAGAAAVQNDQSEMTADGASDEFLAALDIAYAVDIDGKPVDGVMSNGGHTVTVQVPDANTMTPKDVDIVVTITFDPNTEEQAAMGGRVDLAGFQLTLQQVTNLGQLPPTQVG